MKLSVLVPSIRPQNLQVLYDSIKGSFSGEYEMIVIGPNGLPDSLKNVDNVKYIEDWGNPIRSQQIGLLKSKGEYIAWAADDGIWVEGALDIAFTKVQGEPYTTVVMGKYYEGNTINNPAMQSDDYYYLGNHAASSTIPKHYLMLNVGIVSREILIEVGGWDAQMFEVCPCAYSDLAIRLQNNGCKFIIQNEVMFKCSHMPGTTGDHGPINDGQIDHDEPLFRYIYSKPESVNRVKIDINNWEKAAKKWSRRFGR